MQNVEWGEFRIGDLFEIGTGSLLTSSELIGGNIPRISAKSDNNGIIGYYDTQNLENARHFENFITVNFFGTNGGIFYHPYRASVEMKVHTLKMLNKEFNSKTGTFIAGVLKLSLCGFGYGNQLSSSKLKDSDFKIRLPVKVGEIDFEFMESFIAELEAQRIAELEAYLSATGLKDCQLTLEEQQALNNFNEDTIKFNEFIIGDLFEKINTNNVINNLHGNLPATTAIISNNQIGKYISSENATVLKKVFSATANGFGKVFYQPKDFTVLQDSYAFRFIDGNIDTERLHSFVVGVLNKVFSKYDWGYKSGWNKVKYEKIELPVKDGEIDFEFMETFISAIQKLVIKDVVAYADNKIQATKHIVNHGEI